MANNNYTNLNADNAVVESLTRFFGFYDNIYRDPFVSGHAFVFMTKPLLFIDPDRSSNASNGHLAYLNMTRDPIFTQYLWDQVMNQADRKIVEMLSYNTNHFTDSSFLPIITNECKNFDANDINLDSSDFFETKQGFKESLPTSKTLSESGNTLSFSLTEDSNLSITKMMTLWVNYISNITDGTFDANPEMILNGRLDYTSSIYYFVLAPDGKSIRYWSKYTGCWPTNIPYSNMRYNKGSNDLSDISVTFNYTVKEDMNPKILEEFNIISLKLVDSAKLLSKNYIYEINNQYSSIKDSPLLNIDAMNSDSTIANLLKSDRRDPVVVYIPGNNKSAAVDSTNDRFELIFDDFAYQSKFINNIFGQDNYYINDVASNFLKNPSQLDQNWDERDFWAEEIIE